MGSQPYHDKETLERLYHDEGLSQEEIGDKFGVKPNTISQWMSRNDVTTRPKQDAPHKSADILRHLHHEEELTLKEMGERLDRSHGTIRHWMVKHGIPRKDPNRKRLDIPEDKLRELYIDEQKSMGECAEHFDTTLPTIRSRLDEYGIEQRDSKKSQRIVYGESVSCRINTTGYRTWEDRYSGEEVSVHRLQAIAHGADPHAVFSDGMHVHHRNTCRIDNRRSNLELVDNSVHMATHRNNEWFVEDGYPVLETVEPMNKHSD